MQKTIFSGRFSVHNAPVGFNRGIKILYNDGDKITEMTREEFCDEVLKSLSLSESVKDNKGPKVKIIVINDEK